MRTMRFNSYVGTAVLLLTAACGGSSGGGGSYATNHVIFDSLPKDIAHNAAFEGKFSLPTTATVTYSMVDTGGGLTNDTWNVGIAPAAELPAFEAGTQWSAYGPHNGASSVSDSVSVPAGDYALAVRCTNLIDDCKFTFSVDAIF